MRAGESVGVSRKGLALSLEVKATAMPAAAEHLREGKPQLRRDAECRARDPDRVAAPPSSSAPKGMLSARLFGHALTQPWRNELPPIFLDSDLSDRRQ